MTSESMNEKAPRRTTGERGQNEEANGNLHPSPTTPKDCAQLPPLAADNRPLASLYPQHPLHRYQLMITCSL